MGYTRVILGLYMGYLHVLYYTYDSMINYAIYFFIIFKYCRKFYDIFTIFCHGNGNGQIDVIWVNRSDSGWRDPLGIPQMLVNHSKDFHTFDAWREYYNHITSLAKWYNMFTNLVPQIKMIGKSSKHILPNGGETWWFTMIYIDLPW